MLSHAHHAVLVSVLWAVSRGVQDGPEVGVVGSAVDADHEALSVDSSDSPWLVLSPVENGGAFRGKMAARGIGGS